MGIKIDKELLTSEFYRYCNEHGAYPTKTQMDKARGYPSITPYVRIWGSWNKFLVSIGIMGSEGWYVYDEKVLIEKYASSSQEEIIESLLIKKSWSTIKQKARKLELSRNMSEIKREYSDDELLNKLRDLSIQLGRTPRISDIDERSDMPSTKTFQKRFGSWNDALLLLDLKLNTRFNHNKEDIMKDAIDFYNKHGRSPYYNDLNYSLGLVNNYWSSWGSLLAECSLPYNRLENPLNTKEDGIQYLIDLSIKLEKTPSSLDVANDNIPRDWFARNFGTFRRALFESGLIEESEIYTDYDELAETSIKYLIELGYILNRIPSVEEYEDFLSAKETKDYLNRRNLCDRINKKFTEMCKHYLPTEILESELNEFYYDNHGNRCLSVAEMKIGNFLIENNIIFVNEPPYKEVMNIPERLRFDWKVVTEKTVYVEYFGLFVEGQTSGDYLYEYYNKTKRKIKLCKDNDVPLIELYSKDLKNNFNGLIHKFQEHGIDLEIKQAV